MRLLSDHWYRLHTTTFDFLSADGVWTSQSRETCDRGNGATKTAIRREAVEETGDEVGEVTHVFDAFMSPGSVTERLHFYAAPYSADNRSTAGGGIAADGEHITLVELGIDEALVMIEDGRIVDAKTIMLLQWSALRGPFAKS